MFPNYLVARIRIAPDLAIFIKLLSIDRNDYPMKVQYFSLSTLFTTKIKKSTTHCLFPNWWPVSCGYPSVIILLLDKNIFRSNDRMREIWCATRVDGCHC